MPSLTHNTNSNGADVKEREFYNSLREQGRNAGDGSAARVRAGRLIVQAAQDGLIGTDDAKKISQTYGEAAAGKNNIEYANKNSADANASKFRTLIKLGSLNPRAVDGVEVFDRSVESVKSLTQAGNKLGSSAFEKIVGVARKQLEQPETPLDDTEIEKIILPEATDAPTEESTLKELSNKMKRIHDGKKDTGEGAFPSTQLAAAMATIGDRIKELAYAREEAEEAEALAALMTRKQEREAYLLSKQEAEKAQARADNAAINAYADKIAAQDAALTH